MAASNHAAAGRPATPTASVVTWISLAWIESERRFGDRGTTDVHIFISSMPPNFLTASLHRNVRN